MHIKKKERNRILDAYTNNIRVVTRNKFRTNVLNEDLRSNEIFKRETAVHFNSFKHTSVTV